MSESGERDLRSQMNTRDHRPSNGYHKAPQNRTDPPFRYPFEAKANPNLQLFPHNSTLSQATPHNPGGRGRKDAVALFKRDRSSGTAQFTLALHPDPNSYTRTRRHIAARFSSSRKRLQRKRSTELRRRFCRARPTNAGAFDPEEYHRGDTNRPRRQPPTQRSPTASTKSFILSATFSSCLVIKVERRSAA